MAQATRVLPQSVSVPVTKSDKVIGGVAVPGERCGRPTVDVGGPVLPRIKG